MTEAPVVVIHLPYNKSVPFESSVDVAAFGRKTDSQNEYYQMLSCVNQTNGNFKCTEGTTRWRVKDSRFQGCNHGDRGAIFQLKNSAALIVEQRGIDMRVAENNSATYGGFAYLEGPGTHLQLRIGPGQISPIIMKR